MNEWISMNGFVAYSRINQYKLVEYTVSPLLLLLLFRRNMMKGGFYESRNKIKDISKTQERRRKQAQDTVIIKQNK